MSELDEGPSTGLPSVCSKRIRRLRGKEEASLTDAVVVEEPLEIRIENQPISVTMRTPGHDEELALGFLVSESILHSKSTVGRVQLYPRNQFGNVVNVQLAADEEVDLSRLTRHVFASSSCGLCGKATIEAVMRQFKPVRGEWKVERRILLSLPGKLKEQQAAFDQTGGLHAAGLFDLQGKLVVLREDVGRHNAVDKVLGWAFQQERLPLENLVLMVSGRASFEIIQKALSGGICLVAAVSAPSSLAIELAEETNLTLVGFLRSEGMNVYSHSGRVV